MQLQLQFKKNCKNYVDSKQYNKKHLSSTQTNKLLLRLHELKIIT